MQNILNAKQAILEGVNIGSIVESFAPVSMQGTALKKTLVESFNANHLSSVTALTELVVECHKLRHIDAKAYEISENVANLLKDSIKAKMVYCFEMVNAQRQNAITESLKKTLDSLIVLEDDEIINAIRSGALNSFNALPAVNFLTESVKIKVDNNESTSIHEAYNPATYTETDENSNVFVRLHNHVFGINESLVFIAKSPSTKFSFISSIVEAMKHNREKNSFSVTHRELGTFTICEEMIQRSMSGSEEIVEYANTSEFVNGMSMIVEAKNTTSVERSKVNEQKQFVDALVSLKNNMDSMSIADNIVMVENKQTDEKFALIITEGKTYVSTLKSNRLPNILESFTDVREALKTLNHKSGYDATHFFTKQLQIAESESEVKSAQVSGMKLVIEGLETKKREILESISKEKSQPERNDAKIEKLNEALSLTNAHLAEQNGNLAEILK